MVGVARRTPRTPPLNSSVGQPVEVGRTLYAGSDPHYATGRMPYPLILADAVRDGLGLDKLVVDYLGPVRRAGQGLLPAGTAVI